MHSLALEAALERSAEDYLNNFGSKHMVITAQERYDFEPTEEDLCLVDSSMQQVIQNFYEVELATEWFWDLLGYTPSARNKTVKKVIDKWRSEEIVHGELLAPYAGKSSAALGEADLLSKVTERLTKGYRFTSRVGALASNLCADHFIAAHMFIGAVNEMTTRLGYSLLAEKAQSTRLRKMLHKIMVQESVHTASYLKLGSCLINSCKKCDYAANFILQWFFQPVGLGINSLSETERLINYLTDNDSCKLETIYAKTQNYLSKKTVQTITDRFENFFKS
ncbi:MAG: hypothetical protein M3Q64_00230 [bacterium]|nr:hypothetical protein [bacterium]